MTAQTETQVCLNCGNSEQQIPLIAIRFNGSSNWICSQCLPTLIHKPQQLVSKLPGIDTASIQVREH
jgi:hypothetical protein